MSQRKLGRVIALLAVVATLASPALAQRQPASIERRSIWDDPQTRERIYDRMAERYMDGLAEAYQLTEDQRKQVSSRLDALKQEQKEYGAKVQAEVAPLREEMGRLWREQQAGRPVDEQRMAEVGQRMREIWQASPLMNPEKVVGEVEKLLPAEQAGKGRERWTALRQERVREWTQRAGVYRDRMGPGRGDVGGPAGDPWERFVERFCSEFKLDEAQRSTARSVLRDVQARRDRYRESHINDIEAALQVEDWRARREEMDRVMQPIDSLFDELRSRLDKIPTNAQIESVRGRLATRPFEGPPGRGRPGSLDPKTATRPSDMIQPARPMRGAFSRPARD